MRFTFTTMQEAAEYHRQQHLQLVLEGNSLGNNRAKDELFQRIYAFESTSNEGNLL